MGHMSIYTLQSFCEGQRKYSRDQQMAQFTNYKKILFAKHFSTRETICAQSIAIPGHKPTYHHVQYKTKYCPLYYDECRQCITLFKFTVHTCREIKKDSINK